MSDNSDVIQMSRSPKVKRHGFALQASLSTFKPVVFALFAVCMVALVSALGWLGVDGGSQLAASNSVRNNAANQGFIESSIPHNSATNQDSRPFNADDIGAASEAEASPADSAPRRAESAARKPALTGDDSVAAPQTAPEKLATEEGYAAQAGSYNSISDANACISRLRAAGFEAHVAPVASAKRGTWYRVHSGRFQSREEATRHNRKLRASGAAGDAIVTAVEP